MTLKELCKNNGEMKLKYVDEYNSIKASIKASSRMGVKTARFYCKRWTGPKRHMKLIDKEYIYTTILNAMGIKYVTGNNGPRGGVEWDYIEIKIDKRNKGIKDILMEVR